MISTVRAGAAAVVLAVGLAVAGCTGTGQGLSDAAGHDMQGRVVAVAEHAAVGDTAAALAQLDALQQRLDDARAAGEITADRAALVQRSIDLVRADLEAAAAENATPTPTVADGETGDAGGSDSGDSGSGGDSGGGKGNGNGGNGGNGNGNGGNGNGNGGNGNGGNGGNGNGGNGIGNGGNGNGNGNSGRGNGG